MVLELLDWLSKHEELRQYTNLVAYSFSTVTVLTVPPIIFCIFIICIPNVQ